MGARDGSSEVFGGRNRHAESHRGCCVPFSSRLRTLHIFTHTQLAGDWSPPADHSSKTLLRWKGTPAHLHGFRGRKTVGGRGLSLLFDPLVDAFLAAHFLRTGRLPDAGPTVLVLTDFYPLAATNGQGQDWAQQESARFLGARSSEGLPGVSCSHARRA